MACGLRVATSSQRAPQHLERGDPHQQRSLERKFEQRARRKGTFTGGSKLANASWRRHRSDKSRQIGKFSSAKYISVREGRSHREKVCDSSHMMGAMRTRGVARSRRHMSCSKISGTASEWQKSAMPCYISVRGWRSPGNFRTAVGRGSTPPANL